MPCSAAFRTLVCCKSARLLEAWPTNPLPSTTNNSRHTDVIFRIRGRTGTRWHDCARARTLNHEGQKSFQELDSLGISFSTVFPDLAGFARELKLRFGPKPAHKRYAGPAA